MLGGESLVELVGVEVVESLLVSLRGALGALGALGGWGLPAPISSWLSTVPARGA